jgi:biopolymer transport protein ExbD
VIVVQVMSSGELRINEDPVAWDQLANRLEAIFKQRATKVAFIRGEALVEFAQVARVVNPAWLRNFGGLVDSGTGTKSLIVME